MAKKSSRRKQEDCPHCRTGPEVFRYMHRRYVFDVDLARRIVQDGRAPREVEPESVQWCIDTTRIYPQHVPHVNTRYPGIIAHVFYPLPDGTEAHGHLLIDGNHRAARSVELNQPFYAFILTRAESRRILLKSPARPGKRTRRKKPAGTALGKPASRRKPRKQTAAAV